METIMAVVVFAFLIETVVEVLKPVIYRLDWLGEVLGVEMSYLFSQVLAIAGAIVFQVNALPLFGVHNAGVIGQVLTGLLTSGGSNYVHNKLRHITEVTVEEMVIPDEDEWDDK